MKNKFLSPVEILSRELYRLNNDIDRLQMLITLKSHLNNLQLNSEDLQKFFSIFNNEQYRLQAIDQLIPFIYTFITSDSLIKLLELFTNHEYRLNLIETLKNCELLKTNKEVNEILLNEYHQYFHIKNNIKIPEESEANIPITTTSNPIKTGVFEKAKQFVCRVFGGRSLHDELPTKRSITDIDCSEQKKFRSIDSDLQCISLSTSQSYTSIITKSPPPSPLTHQSSMSFHIDESSLPMVTKIHTILDNIDTVLDKIEAQTNSINRHSILNDNLTHNIDQITQTTMNRIEHHVNLNDGSGDTTFDFLDIIEGSNLDENEEIFN